MGIKGCFVCPIYDKENDFRYGYSFFESAVKYEMYNDLYFVFSNTRQTEKFLKSVYEKFKKVPCYINMNDPLKECKCPVTVKKFYALEKLKNEYDYIATLDCECLFIKKFNTGLLLEEIWNSGTMLSSNISIASEKIMRSCCEILGIENNENIQNETKSFQYTWWFNEIPVYKCGNLSEFFAWIDGKRKRNIYSNWNCFDYYIYIFWLLSEGKAKLKRYPIRSDYGIIEELWKWKFFFDEKIEFEMGVHWTSKKRRKYKNPSLCIRFQCDKNQLCHWMLAIKRTFSKRGVYDLHSIAFFYYYIKYNI